MSAGSNPLPATDKRALLAELLARKAASAAIAPTGPSPRIPGPATRTSGRLPASFAQERVWFLHHLAPESPVYNVVAAARVHGPIVSTHVREALRRLLGRHEILRSAFAVDSGGIHVVPRADVTLPFHLHDLTHLAGDAQRVEIDRVCEGDAGRPFDLARPPLFSFRIFRLHEEEHVLFINMHHIVTDSYSVAVLVRECSRGYEALMSGAAPVADLEIQYADFARWQRDALRPDVMEPELRFWREKLRGAQDLALRTDRPRSTPPSFAGGRETLQLSPGLSTALRAFLRVEGMTAYQVVLAAFAVVLLRYTGQEDVVVGCPVTNRSRIETESLIGLFVNTVVLRFCLAGDPTFREVLGRVRAVTLEALAHQELPFEKVVEAVRASGSLESAPLFRIMFGFPQAPTRGVAFGSCTVEPYPAFNGTAQFELSVSITDWIGELGLSAEYRRDLFDAGTVKRLLGHTAALVAAMLANPGTRVSEADFLDEEERRIVVPEAIEPSSTRAPPSCLDAFRE
ncbi:MAG TPA: condensation domain-containing protein, partial [Polyangiaceae bacterium]|nr:condensation domain-containing protein [Polyangiaceae bacterium]